MPFQKRFLLALTLLTPFLGLSQHVVELNDDLDEFLFNFEYIEFIEDSLGQWTIDDVSSTNFKERFKPSNEEYVDRHVPQTHRPESYYWVRLNIKHPKETQKQWLLEFANQSIDHLEVYIPNKKGGYSKEIIGDNYPFEQRKFLHKNNEVLLPPHLKGANTYYLRIQSRHTNDIVIVLRSLEKFVNYGLSEYILFGVFFGMLLIVTIYNSLMYSALREQQYLFYIIYVCSFGLYFASQTGIAFQYFWQNFTEWNQIAKEVALFLVVIAGLLFTRQFLNTKKNAPFIDLLIRSYLVIRTLIFICAFFYHPLFILRIIELVPVLLALSAGIIVYKKGVRSARYYIVAYSILLVGFIVKATLTFGFIPHSSWSFYAEVIAFSFEMFFLMVALGDKVSIIREDKESSQEAMIQQLEETEKLKDKVNRELESKVQERTVELNSALDQIKTVNNQLEEQAEEINRMNMLLDLDNQNLKKDIKDTISARIKTQTVDFEEFQKVYIDKLACMRFLAEKKKDRGFKCHKCGNEKQSPGIKKFSRRCSKCGYNESVTAYTIFHGVRFPIEKAFYIFYLTVSRGTDLTVDDIAEKVDLRRNTCWTFRNKVLKLMEDHKVKDKEEYWDKLFDYHS